jgi:two-component system response regulator PilR (NtrC family)
LIIIEKCIEKRLLLRENVRLRGELEKRYGFRSIVGRSRAMVQLLEDVARVAGARTSVLLCGESGTGKELVARSLHFNSPRRDRPFVVVSCGAIPDNLLESELFGHVKGAFTGAIATKKGLIDSADGGTVFLDEIGELSGALQVKLLRVLQERTIKPVGGLSEIPVDVRVVAATNRDLTADVRSGRFREDLYYRLNVIQIRIPPLRERAEDIPPLAEHFLRKLSAETGKTLSRVSPEAMAILSAYDYPGNVRELENIIERAVAYETDPTELSARALPDLASGPGVQHASLPAVPDAIPADFDLERHLSAVEQDLLRRALGRSAGSKTEAAKLLGISFRAMRYKLHKYGLGEQDDPADQECP